MSQRYKQKEKGEKGQAWWSTPGIPALKRQKLEDYSKFKAGLIYIMNSGTARNIVRPVSNTDNVAV